MAAKRTEAFCRITERRTSDRKHFALLSCPCPSWDHLKHWSLSSVSVPIAPCPSGSTFARCHWLWGLSAWVHVFTCCEHVPLGNRAGFVPLQTQLHIFKNISYWGRTKHLLTFSTNRYLCYRDDEDTIIVSPSFGHPFGRTWLMFGKKTFPATKISQTRQSFNARFYSGSYWLVLSCINKWTTVHQQHQLQQNHLEKPPHPIPPHPQTPELFKLWPEDKPGCCREQIFVFSFQNSKHWKANLEEQLPWYKCRACCSVHTGGSSMDTSSTDGLNLRMYFVNEWNKKWL